MNVSSILRDVDAAVITSEANLYYLSGIENADATILLTESSAYYVTSPLYEVEAKRTLPDYLTLVVFGRTESTAFVRDRLKGSSRVGMELPAISVARYNDLTEGAAYSILDVSDHLSKMRIVKSPEEAARIKRAESIVDEAFEKTLPEIRVGVTEKEIRAQLQYHMLKGGADGFAFDTIVAFGENAAKPHAIPSDRVLRPGDCIVMDFGAKYKGYCSDFTRTICCGEPSKEFASAYGVVLGAHKAALAYVEAGGRKAREAHRIASEYINGSPFCGLFTHSLGHGVGVEIHESPYLGEKSTDVLEEGSFFTIEPGVYKENAFGIRIESLVTIENGKLTVTDRSNKEIITV